MCYFLHPEKCFGLALTVRTSAFIGHSLGIKAASHPSESGADEQVGLLFLEVKPESEADYQVITRNCPGVILPCVSVCECVHKVALFEMLEPPHVRS